MESDRLRVLFDQSLTRELDDAGIPDPGSFLVGINAGIDRRHATGLRALSNVLRPAVLIPVLTVSLFLVIAGMFYFSPDGQIQQPDSLFPGMITETDVEGLPDMETLTPMLNDVLLSDMNSSNDLVSEEIFDADNAVEFNTAIDASMLEDLTYSAVVSAGLDYFSTDEVLDYLTEVEANDIVTNLQNTSIMLL